MVDDIVTRVKDDFESAHFILPDTPAPSEDHRPPYNIAFLPPPDPDHELLRLLFRSDYCVDAEGAEGQSLSLQAALAVDHPNAALSALVRGTLEEMAGLVERACHRHGALRRAPGDRDSAEVPDPRHSSSSVKQEEEEGEEEKEEGEASSESKVTSLHSVQQLYDK